ncbi:hypothetical protein AB4Z46_33055 [Variovorax sp. M-6]|uniref:hypothetical protein n=1 Tax=Variovorax sp. M-6 TaxID=3233041 RepID=UPI003F98212A
MANFSKLHPWDPETPGERLFLALYDLVKEDVPELFVDRNWFVSATGLSEFLRLTAAMELTHRCLNAVSEHLLVSPDAPVSTVLQLLRSDVEIYGQGPTTRGIAELTLQAGLAALEKHFTPNRADTIHRESNRCCWCGKAVSRGQGTAKGSIATIEHLWPAFLGGSSSQANAAIACDSCNGARQHAFSWAWFGVQSFNAKLDKHQNLPRNVRLALALHRLIRVASGRTRISRTAVSLKTAAKMLNVVEPKIRLDQNRRYTFFELIQFAEE